MHDYTRSSLNYIYWVLLLASFFWVVLLKTIKPRAYLSTVSGNIAFVCCCFRLQTLFSALLPEDSADCSCSHIFMYIYDTTYAFTLCLFLECYYIIMVFCYLRAPKFFSKLTQYHVMSTPNIILCKISTCTTNPQLLQYFPLDYTFVYMHS